MYHKDRDNDEVSFENVPRDQRQWKRLRFTGCSLVCRALPISDNVIPSPFSTASMILISLRPTVWLPLSMIHRQWKLQMSSALIVFPVTSFILIRIWSADHPLHCASDRRTRVWYCVSSPIWIPLNSFSIVRGLRRGAKSSGSWLSMLSYRGSLRLQLKRCQL